jgi:hypothetical protein
LILDGPGGLLSINSDDGTVTTDFTSLPRASVSYIKEWDEELQVAGQIGEDDDSPTNNLVDFSIQFRFTYTGQITNTDSNVGEVTKTWIEKNGLKEAPCTLDINCDRFAGNVKYNLTFD